MINISWTLDQTKLLKVLCKLMWCSLKNVIKLSCFIKQADHIFTIQNLISEGIFCVDLSVNYVLSNSRIT